MSQHEAHEIISNPAKHYGNPKELANDVDIPQQSKILALKQWDADIRQLQVASEESMAATSHASLKDVHDALRSLGYEPDEENTAADKSGNLE